MTKSNVLDDKEWALWSSVSINNSAYISYLEKDADIYFL